MSGAVKNDHIRPVVEELRDTLAGWVGRLLFFQARLVLIKSVIASYPIHSMAEYKWPSRIIRDCETAIRNFLWTGDSKTSRCFVVGFDKLCCPFSEGGLGLTRLKVMNKALIMKLWWKIWAQFLHAKYLKVNGDVIDYHFSIVYFS